MSESKSSLLLLTCFSLVFVILKWPVLHLPYFWDEAWSYIPAITEMAKGWPCLLPGCISEEFSRGHPLLFYFLASVWMKWISSAPFAMHGMAVIISLLTVYSFYKTTSLVLQPKWAFFACLTLMVQEVFFVQASFVLPEMLIALLVSEALRSYVQSKWVYFFVIAGLLGLTKEIGLLIISCFILFHLFSPVRFEKKGLFVYASLLPAAIFYILQKIYVGWFFNPLHTGMIEFTWSAVFSKSKLVFQFLFWQQGRWILLIGILLGGMIVFLKTKIDLHKIKFDKKYKLLAITLLIGVTGFFGSILNFLMLRYTLFLVLLLVLIFSFILQLLANTRQWLYYVLVALVPIGFVFSMFYDLKTKNWHDDVSLNYSHAVIVHQQMVTYAEQNFPKSAQILTHFLMEENLTRTSLKYLYSSEPFTNVRYGGFAKPDDEILLFSCIEYDEYNHLNIQKDIRYQLLKRFEAGKAWGEVYSKK